MITQTLQLNLVPKGVWPRLYVSQYDAGSRTLTFEIYNGDQRFTLTSGTTAKIQGTKPDRHGFSYDAEVDTSNNIITIDITQQMTAAHGEAYCELVLFKSGQRIGTLNFVMMIQQAGLNDETDTSDSDLPDIIAEATEQMLTAEAYAKGTRDGIAVTSGQTGYHDNSKYYKEQAATQASNASTSATNANTNALKAEGYAVGKQNGTTQTSGTYYHNNAQYYKEQAASSATTASTKAGEASSSANTASQKASAASTSAQTASDKALVAEGYAKGTQNGTPVGSTSPYYHNNAEYFKNLANPTVAANVSFNNSGTEMSSTNVQDGIVENRTSIQNLSNQVKYNTANGVKNLFHFQSLASSSYLNINWTFDGEENTIKMNSSSASTSGSYYVQKKLELDPSKQYVFKATFDSGINNGLWLTIVPSDEDTTYRKAISPSYPMIEYTPKAGVTKYYVYVYTNASMTYSNYNIANIMVVEKDVYNFDSSYEPYAMTNQQLTTDKVGMDLLSEVGAVNLLDSDIVTQTILNGNGTITANADGSYTCRGSVPAGQNSTTLSTKTVKLKKGVYKWFASFDGNSSIGTTRGVNCFIKGINGTNDWYRSFSGTTYSCGIINITQDSTIQFGIVTYNDTNSAITINETFYPAIYPASYTGDYVPYAKSNKELTEYIDNMYEPHMLCDGLKNTTVDLSSVPDYADIGIVLNYSGSRVIGHYRKNHDLTTNGNYTIAMPSYYEDSSHNVGAILRINNWQLSVDRYIWGGVDHKADAQMYVWWSYC